VVRLVAGAPALCIRMYYVYMYIWYSFSQRELSDFNLDIGDKLESLIKTKFSELYYF
jgi:hypothetical protein